MRMYKITLSAPEKVTAINQRLQDGRAVRAIVKLRNIELEILESCMMIFAKQVQKSAAYLQVITNLNAIQSVTDKIMFINFTKTDLENVIIGFEMTKGVRQDAWTKAISLIQQFEAPEEIEIEEQKIEEPNVVNKPS